MGRLSRSQILSAYLVFSGFGCTGAQNLAASDSDQKQATAPTPASAPEPSSPADPASAAPVDRNKEFDNGTQPLPITGLNLLACGPVAPPTYGCGIIDSTTSQPTTAVVTNEVVTLTLSDNTTVQPSLTPATTDKRFIVYFQIPDSQLSEVTGVGMNATVAGYGAQSLTLPQVSSALSLAPSVATAATAGTTATTATSKSSGTSSGIDLSNLISISPPTLIGTTYTR